MSPKKLTVFLCYASQDRFQVQGLYDRLIREPWIEPWMDARRLIPGQRWEYVIEDTVERADAVIVCLSRNSVAKEGYVQKEIKMIMELSERKPENTIYIIPLRLDDCEPPRQIRKYHFVDYYPSPKRRKKAFELIKQSLRARAAMLEIRSHNKHVSVLLKNNTCLIGRHGEYKNKSIPLGKELSLGRQSSNTLKFKNLNISRKHAKIFQKNGKYYIVDLASSFGTYLERNRDKKRIFPNMPYLLKSGDKLFFGASSEEEFEFKL